MTAFDQSRAIEHLRRYSWATLPRLVSPSETVPLIDELLSAPSKRVTVGASDRWWDEFAVKSDGELSKALHCRAIKILLSDLMGAATLRQIQLWGQIYQVGQYIPWHRDVSGTIQLLLCLESAPDGCGGQFLMHNKGVETSLSLTAGDGLLFRATDISHSTTQIMSTPAHPSPRRVVAVARFFYSAAAWSP